MKRKLTGLLLAAVLLSLALLPRLAEGACFIPFRTIVTHYGYYDIQGNPHCTAVIGPTPPWVVVGQEISECDGSYSSWGLICDNDFDTEIEPCPEVCE